MFVYSKMLFSILFGAVLIYSMSSSFTLFDQFRTAERVSISWRRRETRNLDCGRVLAGDKTYIQKFSGEHRIPLISDLPNLDMSCRSIQNRIVPFSFHLKPLKVGVAFARVVYRDYEFLEKQVQMSFHPQNFFCFAIDSKASDDFKWRIRRLGRCLPNVYIIDEELPIDSAGHNMNFAHYNCMREMRKVPSWEYFVLMQNHDVIGKSVYEISRIFELLDGANDIEIDKEFGRVDKSLQWDLKTLQLFRDESNVPEDLLEESLNNAKGAVQGSMSRQAVDWMVRTVDPETFIEQWNEGGYGVDEQWLATFQSNEFLGMPGHFTGKCVNETGERSDFISRWSKWSFPDEKDERCGSRSIRHGVCLLGIEDFPIVASMPNIMFNKMMPSFDYSLVECTAELLFNRTFLGQEDHRLEEDYYSNMVNVLYHKHHREPNYVLNCTPGYLPWNAREYPLGSVFNGTEQLY